MTFAELKRKLQPGTRLQMISRNGEKCDFPREVGKVQTNALQMTNGSWLHWPAASLVTITEAGFSLHAAAERPLTDEEQRIWDGRPQDKAQEEADAMSDGNTMYYRNMRYFKESAAPWLNAHSEAIQGKRSRYVGRELVVVDNSLKGAVGLEYRFI